VGEKKAGAKTQNIKKGKKKIDNGGRLAGRRHRLSGSNPKMTRVRNCGEIILLTTQIQGNEKK